jgi:integrase
MIEDFLRDLQTAGRSHDLIRRVRTALVSMLKVAIKRKLVAVNVALGVDTGGDAGRHDEPLEIPDIAEGFAIAAACDLMAGKGRALILTALFSGLRSSELRGLRWANVDLDGRKLRVAERVDKYGVTGSPKSKNSRREVPLPNRVVNASGAWPAGASWSFQAPTAA